MHRRNFLFGTAIFPVYFGVSLGLTSISKAKTQLNIQLTSQDKVLAKKVGFDEAVLLLIKAETQGKLDQLKDYSFDSYPARLVALEGISVVVPEEQLWNCFNIVKKKLSAGYLATVFENDNYGNQAHPLTNLIAIIKTNDRYDFLRIRNTNGANYGLETKDIVAKLKTWERQFEFDITLVGFDFVGLEFKALPNSLCAFAEEIYVFCPGSVSQGVSLAYDVLDDPGVFKAAKRLCAGVRSNAKYDAETVRGIELLAYDMQKTKQLLLWWD